MFPLIVQTEEPATAKTTPGPSTAGSRTRRKKSSSSASLAESSSGCQASAPQAAHRYPTRRYVWQSAILNVLDISVNFTLVSMYLLGHPSSLIVKYLKCGEWCYLIMFIKDFHFACTFLKIFDITFQTPTTDFRFWRGGEADPPSVGWRGLTRHENLESW